MSFINWTKSERKREREREREKERVILEEQIQRYANLLIPDRKRSPHTLATISPTKSKSSCTLLLLTLSYTVIMRSLCPGCVIIINMLPACDARLFLYNLRLEYLSRYASLFYEKECAKNVTCVLPLNT